VKYLLDTCLISELVKKEPNRNVMLWINNQDENTLYLSVLTIGELQKGISKLPDSARKAELQAWVNNDLVARFQRRLLSIDAD
jgi:predicted nucleic acid-binding protein